MDCVNELPRAPKMSNLRYEKEKILNEWGLRIQIGPSWNLHTESVTGEPRRFSGRSVYKGQDAKLCEKNITIQIFEFLEQVIKFHGSL